MPRTDRKASLRKGPIPYVDGRTEKYGTFLMELPEAADSADRMLRCLRDAAGERFEVRFGGGEDVRGRLVNIATHYWNDRSYYSRPRDDENGLKALRSVKRAALTLAKALEENPENVRGRLTTALLHFDRNAPGTIKSFRDELRAILKALNRTQQIETGAPEKVHIKRAVLSVSSIWQDIEGKPLAKSIRVAPGAHNLPEFDQPGPQFVYQMLRAIDDKVEVQEVATALKAQKVKPKTDPKK